jgi:hypothetical protein
MNILPFVQWVDGSPLGHAVRDSLWLFPVIEASHLIGLAVIGGCVLIVNLRLLGLGLRSQPASQIARDTRPYLLGSLGVMLVSGFLLFASEAIKCYEHDAFWFKMACLAMAIFVTFAVQNKAIEMDDRKGGNIQSKVVALTALMLWTGVGVGGRWIGFS